MNHLSKAIITIIIAVVSGCANREATQNAATIMSIETALVQYEQIRTLLANDSIDGIGEHSDRIALELQTIASPDKEVAKATMGIQAALEISKSTDIETSRLYFQDLSESIIALASIDEEILEGLHPFMCPMVDGYQNWIQTGSELENPYMGQSMLTCGSAIQWSEATGNIQSDDIQSQDNGTAGHEEVDHYTCPMHPSVVSKTIGACPICGMDLTPVALGDGAGTVVLDDVKWQRIGVVTEAIETRLITKTIRAVGAISPDQGNVIELNSRVDGWVEKLHAKTMGMTVTKGQPLLQIYSPELFAAQKELLTAIKHRPDFAAVVKERLRLLGMTSQQIQQVIAAEAPKQRVSLLSPANGVVLKKQVIEGSHVAPGTPLFQIVDLSTVWIEADFYEADIPLISIGQTVTVDFPYIPDHQRIGTIDFIYPYLDPSTRTTRVRVLLDNADGALRLDMYGDLNVEVDLGARLTVPEQAVIFTGPNKVVFVDLGDGKLAPKRVEIGQETGQWYEVVSGLNEGDRVVTSGAFLVASESRLRSPSGNLVPDIPDETHKAGDKKETSH